ncbi:MAG: FG-GAP repeat protein [Acidobacteriota bacterium]
MLKWSFSASIGLIVALLISATASGQTEIMILASDGEEDDRFGFSTSVHLDTAIVGAISADVFAGSAYIFSRSQGGSNGWSEVTKLTASESDPNFGNAVSVHGETAVAGAILGDAVYIFGRDQGGVDQWGQVKRITSSDGVNGDRFGGVVSVHGDTLIVGASWDDDAGSQSGSAYVFSRNQGGPDNWGEVTKLTASDAGTMDHFGGAVSVHGDTIIVGAWLESSAGLDSGSAYVFERNQGGADNWGEVVKLTASDAAVESLFGFSVSVHGDTAIVGARNAETPTVRSGAAYIFSRNQGGVGSWGEVTKLVASDAAVAEAFGNAVSLHGDTAIIGTFPFNGDLGSAYVFSRNQGGVDNWGEVTKLIASDSEAPDDFGNSVAVHDDTVIVGAPRDTEAGVRTGSAYLFRAITLFVDGFESGDTSNWSTTQP